VAFAALLLFAAIVDTQKHEIPNVVLILICFTAAFRILFGNQNPVEALEGLLFAALPLLIISLVKNGAIGGADIKLSAAAGLFLGFTGAGFMLLVACLLLLCMSALLKFFGKLKVGSRVAFAPYIAISGIFTYILILLGG
jgi:leader peptidase (prepilin peptidase)/N-methyltransferase